MTYHKDIKADEDVAHIKMPQEVVIEKDPVPAYQVLVYGEAGIGKTTFAKYSPNPYFLDLESGCIGIGKKKKKAFPIIGYNAASQASVQTLNKFLDQMLVTDTKLPFQTLVVDSLTRLDEYAEQEVIAEEKARAKNPDSIKTIGDLPYGAGYSMVKNKIMDLVNKCMALSIQKGVNLIMITHSKDKQVKKLGLLPYDKVCPRLSKGALASIIEIVPFSFYLGKGIHDKVVGESTNRGLFTAPDIFSENVKRRVWLPKEIYDLETSDAETSGEKTVDFWRELDVYWEEAHNE